MPPNDEPVPLEWMGCSCGCRFCAYGVRSPISPLKPEQRRIHVPNRLGGSRSCAFLASASWAASLNQIGLGMLARQLRDMPPGIHETRLTSALADGGSIPCAGMMSLCQVGKSGESHVTRSRRRRDRGLYRQSDQLLKGCDSL